MIVFICSKSITWIFVSSKAVKKEKLSVLFDNFITKTEFVHEAKIGLFIELLSNPLFNSASLLNACRVSKFSREKF